MKKPWTDVLVVVLVAAAEVFGEVLKILDKKRRKA
jgi:hypothetical protein